MKKITAIILVAALAAVFTGCQKNEAPKQAPQSAPTSTASAPTGTAAAPAAPEHK